MHTRVRSARYAPPRGPWRAVCCASTGVVPVPCHTPQIATYLPPRTCPPQSLNNLAVMYTSQGRSGEAAAMLQAATAAVPAYAEAWNNLGVVQRDIGAVADAIASYERAAALAPEQHNAGAPLQGRVG